ncbi:MAG TPA: ABC transporter ATP-binding protein [Cyclobacteriaceae bacterium]
MKLVIENLSKTYPGNIQALVNINIEVDQGLFGILGPNGAGKSTLMRTIATLQEPDIGSIHLDDINVLTEKTKVRKILGYLPQEFGVYPNLTANNMLNHIAVLKGVTIRGERKELVDALLHKVNLWTYKNKNMGTFSNGMKQRFGIAQALIGDPTLIIVDEPTAGLDPAERNRFLNLLSELGENVIVILSTHIVDDVKELCSRMAIISEGRLLYIGSPGHAISELNGKVWSRFVEKSELPEFRLSMNILFEKLIAGKQGIHVLSDEKPGPEFWQVQAGLEDVYFAHLLRAGEQTSQLMN